MPLYTVLSPSKKSKQLELINTIEINPFDFADSNFEHPNGSAMDLPEEWDKFWKKCLADSKLDKLQSIRKGSYLVDINSISDAELHTILQRHLKGVDVASPKSQVSSIIGGIVVKTNDEFVGFP